MARNLVLPYGQVIEVESMSTYDSIALLRSWIHVDQSDEDDARRLVQTLECIPLAVTHAGAYISNGSSRMNVSTYLELFEIQQSEFSQGHLLNDNDARDLQQNRSIPYSVITTWQISFDKIRYTSPKATNLLALMSMFDGRGIPKQLVRQGVNQLEFENAIAILISFSLVQAEIGGRLFDLHPLVQLSIQQWLRKQHQFQRFVKKAYK